MLDRVRWLVLLVACLGSGCSHFLDLSARTSFDERDDSAIIVVRVSPKTTVVLAKGIVEGDGWRTKRLPDATQFWAEDGFVVARVTPTADDEAYGIVMIRPESYTDSGDDPPATYQTVRWPKGAGVMKFGPLAPGPVSQLILNGDTLAPQPYFPNTNLPLPTFKASAGKLAYVGAIRVDASVAHGSQEPPDKIALTPVSSPLDREEVIRYLTTHYPKVHGPVRTEPLQMLRRAEYLD